MKLRVFAFFALALVGFDAHAGSTDAVIVAAMRLSEEPNYRWTTSVVDDARTYEIHGQTTSSGFTRVKMPMVSSVRRRLGRSVTDTEIEAIFKGNVKCVLATEEGWLTPDELPPPVERPPADGLPTGVLAGILGTTPPPRPVKKEPDSYSNLQLGISPPHEELGVIVTSHLEMTVNGDTATGVLNNVGAQLLLVRDGQREISPLEATGSFKLWLRDGVVTRYQLQLDGVLSIATPAGRKQIRVRQNTDTSIKAIGTTVVDVPLEARQKLDT